MNNTDTWLIPQEFTDKKRVPPKISCKLLPSPYRKLSLLMFWQALWIFDDASNLEMRSRKGDEMTNKPEHQENIISTYIAGENKCIVYPFDILLTRQKHQSSVF